MNMEYNTGRNKLVIPEYGRHIQKLIEHAVDVEDVEERNKLARAIVDVMGQLNPHLRDITDFKHKLWDHLFIISNFKLEVDSPYPKPDQQTFRVRPDMISYPSGRIRYRHYGKTLEKVIDELVKMEESPLKDQVAVNVANFMKMLYVNWNKDSVTDEVIKAQLNEMSGGKIVIGEEVKLINPPEVHVKSNARKGSGRKGRSRGSNGRSHRKNQ